HGRPEPAIMADRKRHAGVSAGIEHRLCVGMRERQRLFAKHWFARGGAGLDLGTVERMRGGEKDGVGRRICERGLEILNEVQLVLRAIVERALARGLNGGEET